MSRHPRTVSSALRRHCCAAAALLISFPAIAAFAQNTAPPAAPAKTKTTTIVANTDEVSLDIVACTKKKKLIRDLKASDLAVTDNGVPVTLHDLHLVTEKSGANHLITLVFDPMDGTAAANAQSIADKIVKMLPPSGFQVSVLSLGSRLRLIQPFTADPQALHRAIEVATMEGEVQRSQAIAAAEKNLQAVSSTGVDEKGAMADVHTRAMAKTTLAALEASQRILEDQHTRPALAGLLALARSQQEFKERKSVIYFAYDGQMDSDALQMVHTIVGAANRADVSMYTVDMTGIGAGTHDQLMSMIAMGPSAGINPTASTKSPMASQMTPAQQMNPAFKVQTQDPAGPGAGTMIATNTMAIEGDGAGDGQANSSPLLRLAANTGGAYIDGQDSVRKPLAQMLADMTTYYEASYTPPAQQYDGAFRSIAVKPLRADLRVRAKSGYFSIPTGGVEGIRPFEAPLQKILSDAELPSALNFRASVLHLGALPDGNTSSLVVEVPLSELELHEDPSTNLYAAHVSILAQIKDKNGVVVVRFGEDIPRHGALQSEDEIKRQSITIQRHFVAIPGEYLLETAVMDRQSEAAGAQRIRFTVPPPSAGPSLSDLVLVRRMDNYRSDADAGEPLRFENGKVTPNLSGEVMPSAKSVSLFFILHTDPNSPAPPALEMQLLRDGSPAGHKTLPIHEAKGASATGAIPYLASLDTSALRPGLYDVKTTLTQGGQKAEGSIAFTVEGPSIPAATSAPLDAASLVANAVSLHAAGAEPRNAAELAITVPDKAVPPPTPSELAAIIADARQSAVRYADHLPNFICLEITKRATDSSGASRWKQKDTLVQMLSYHEHHEDRRLLEKDGEKVKSGLEDLKGTFSTGEFGGVLAAVFEDSSKASFQWKETDSLGAGVVQVLDYKVDLANSDFHLTSHEGDQIPVGFHGQAYIDSATRTVRRITLTADNIPQKFPIRAAAIAVDYDYVVINDHDYLMPVAGKLVTQEGRRAAVLNQFELRDFRHFGSEATILGFNPVN
jgi:VWFA-related protein